MLSPWYFHHSPPYPYFIFHIIVRMARPTNFTLVMQMEDDDPHQSQVWWPPRSKVVVARLRDLSELSWPNTVPVSLAAGRGILCRPKTAATLLGKFKIKFISAWNSVLSYGRIWIDCTININAAAVCCCFQFCQFSIVTIGQTGFPKDSRGKTFGNHWGGNFPRLDALSGNHPAVSTKR